MMQKMKNTSTDFGKLLGPISNIQLQAALDEFGLGELESATAIPFGLFGQNIFIKNTLGKEYVLRTHSHYDWQLPTEHFFGKLIHEKTHVPSPWPYLFTESDKIFGFKFGFAMLPRLPGQNTADPQVYNNLDSTKKSQLAEALARSLHELQKLTWPYSGKYNPSRSEVEEFKDGYINRTISRAKDNLETSESYAPMKSEDKQWAEQLLGQFKGLDEGAFQPVIVHEDYNKNNVTVAFTGSECHVTGLFDLMTAHFGDGLADLPRQFSMFVEDDPALAKLYLQSYFTDIDLDGSTKNRLLLYLIDDRLLVWQYYHRPEHIDQWEQEPNFRKWLETYISVMNDSVRT